MDGLDEALASYVPRYVLHRVATDGAPDLPTVEPLTGAVLLADISGFTSLSERMADRGPDGAEMLTLALNQFFGRVIDLVTLDGGEVISFAGDALLALWPSELDEDSLGEAVHRAAACALALTIGGFGEIDHLEADLTLRLTLSAGGVHAVHLGGVNGRRYSVVTGRPLDQVSDASVHVAAGEVVIDERGWELLTGRADGDELAAGYHRITRVDPPPVERREAGPPPRWGGAAVDLSSYISPAVLSREESGQGAWLAELRRLTVVFVNLPDFGYRTDLDTAQRVVAALQVEFARHETTINKLSVDSHGVSLVAAAGLPPLSHDDDPSRGVRAALAVAETLRRHGWRGAVGVATGRAFCGPVGNQTRREYTMIGDVVNVAARLMQLALETAGPGEVVVLCEAASHRATRHRLEYGPPEEVVVKGKTSPLVVYRPLARRVGTVTGGIAVVGRHRERQALRAALDTVGTGAARVLVFEGEPGIGKSRLLAEARDLARERGFRLVSGAGDAVERTAPYHAWREVFAALFEVDERARPEVQAAQALRSLRGDSRPLAPLLNVVLGLDLPDTEQSASLQGEMRTEATKRILLDILTRALTRPLVITLDDAHWFDTASWSLVHEMARQSAPVLLMLTTRPTEGGLGSPEHARLVAQPTTQVLALGPLEGADAVDLVCARLGVASLPTPVAELIIDKAAGNPLFSEELAYALRDSGLVRVAHGVCTLTRTSGLGAIALPDTVQGVIGNRIDELEPRSQLALKVASVIGATFAPDVVHDVYPIAPDRGRLEGCLDTLVRRNLTLVQQPQPYVLYAFRHALTRDVAYNRMLFAQRRELHRSVAEWYEARFGANLASVYGVLAHHWTRAEVVDKACQYLALASAQALDNGMGREAVDLGLQAASLLGVDFARSPTEIGPEIAAALEAIEKRLAGQPIEDLAALPPATDETVAAAIGIILQTQPAAHMSRQPELFAMMGLKNLLLTLEHGATPYAPGVIAIYAMLVRPLTGDTSRAFALSSLAKRLAERDSPAFLSYAGFVHTWFVHHWVEPMSSSLADIMVHARLGFDYGDITFGCFNAAIYPFLLALTGNPLDRIIAVAAENQELIAGRSRASTFHCLLEAQFSKALSGRTTGRCSLSDREGEGVVDETWDLASIRQTELDTQIAFYSIYKMRLHYYYGEYSAALAFAEQADSLLAAFAGQPVEAEFTLIYALALLGKAAADGDPTAVEQARARLAQVKSWEGYSTDNFRHKSLMIEGELALVEGDARRAAALLVEAAESAERLGLVHHTALARELAGRALQRAGDRAGAEELLRQAMADYGRWGALAKVDDVADTLRSLGG